MAEPVIEHVCAFGVGGISIRTTNAAEKDVTTAQIPGLWQHYFSENIEERLLQAAKDTSTLYGVYTHYDSDVHGAYSLLIGREVERISTSYPVLLPDQERDLNQLQSVMVEEGYYLVFTGEGNDVPKIIYNTWQEVWDYFSENQSLYHRKYSTDFECYDQASPDKIKIFISVAK